MDWWIAVPVMLAVICMSVIAFLIWLNSKYWN